MSPFEMQIGGSHYKVMGIQLTRFTMQNGWDSAAHTILKYLIRHRSKNGAEDIQKSLHCVAIREATLRPWNTPAAPLLARITMLRFIEANEITDYHDFAALLLLEAWVDGEPCCQQLTEAIEEILATYGVDKTA